MSPTHLSRRLWLEVRDRLAVLESPEAVAAATQLPLDTIAAIASGQLLPSRIVVDDHDPERDEILQATRCRGCGGLVYVWPCLACQLEGPAAKSPADHDQPRLSGLALKHKRRRERARQQDAA
jgi:hypothetical protein